MAKDELRDDKHKGFKRIAGESGAGATPGKKRQRAAAPKGRPDPLTYGWVTYVYDCNGHLLNIQRGPKLEPPPGTGA